MSGMSIVIAIAAFYGGVLFGMFVMCALQINAIRRRDELVE